ncbi:MAG: Na+/H+ antiporter NhaA, partial [Bacteroidetes bacterium]|nr:Na+/H+ antiporter NhaA [Bacteroidota bacterium]
CRIPAELNWFNIAATGLLAGIGFTMSIFVTLLAYTQPAIIDNTKLSILLSSLVAGIFGLWLLQLSLKSNRFPADF